MFPLRLTGLCVAAALGLLCGCQGSGGGSCNNGGGFFSRLCSRRGTVVYDGPVMASPAHGLGGTCYEGGPLLGDPGTINGGIMPYQESPGMLQGPPAGIQPAIPAPPTGSIPPPGGMLPAPTTQPPPLAPVPQQPGLATPVPASPSLRRR